MKTVCLDPGHGLGNVNGSPDGLYKEHEAMWDIYERMVPILCDLGIQVVSTRPQQSDYPSLSQRAATSNNANADAFVSLHSNAAGNDGWYSARGLVIYTASGPMSAPRNILAADLVARFIAQGDTVIRSEDGIAYGDYTVLTATIAPAVLIEYGFHTSEADVALLMDPDYRQRLAESTAYGIADFLGIEVSALTEEQVRKLVREEYATLEKERAELPITEEGYAKSAQDFVMREGISDGSRPRSYATREEVWVMLQRALE